MIMDVMKTNSDGFSLITDMLIKRYKMVAGAQVEHDKIYFSVSSALQVKEVKVVQFQFATGELGRCYVSPARIQR